MASVDVTRVGHLLKFPAIVLSAVTGIDDLFPLAHRLSGSLRSVGDGCRQGASSAEEGSVVVSGRLAF